MTEFKIDEEYFMKLNSKTKLWDYFKNGKRIPKSPKKLFKFYPLNINSIDSLLNNYFHLANPRCFNDPFDCNINLVGDHDESVHQISGTVKRNNFENIGIVSLTEVIDNHLMWAHYTNNYRGFAIEFIGNKVTVDIRKEQLVRWSMNPVIYPEKPSVIGKDFPFAAQYVFTTKFKHWEYEKEWRIITELGEERDRTLFYYKNRVKGLYIGHQLIDENESAYRLILEIHSIRFPKIPVFVVYPHPKKLELQFERVIN